MGPTKKKERKKKKRNGPPHMEFNLFTYVRRPNTPRRVKTRRKNNIKKKKQRITVSMDDETRREF